MFRVKERVELGKILSFLNQVILGVVVQRKLIFLSPRKGEGQL